MKQHQSIFTLAASLACTLILALTACTPQALDELAPGTDAVPLTISVTDGGLYATPTPESQTRATEQGYQTIFTDGDKIGLYVVKNGAVEKSNLCLTLQAGKWTLPGDELYYTADKSFYTYYPYKDDSYMEGKVSPGSKDFFETLVNMWQTKNNQSNYADYTASDLMTARGEYSNGTLHFAMEHRMALLIVRFPTTLYNYTEQIDGREIHKSYYRHTVLSSPCLHENPSTERILLNLKNDLLISVQHYLNENIENSGIKTLDLNLQRGKYTIHKIEGGAVTEVERPLKEGDYYMKDGGILPAEEADAMTDEYKKNCLGVVFWVGEKDGLHWTQTGIWNGDQLLMRDHPGCVHGMVVALRDASDSGQEWSSSNEGLYEWAQNYVGFTKKETEDLGLIKQSNLFYGYCCSRRLGLFKAKTGNTTNAYDAILDYAGSHPVPYSCSGWFFPGKFELTCIWSDSPDSRYESIRIKELNEMLSKAGGVGLKEQHYWSSYDVLDKAFSMNMLPNLSDFNNTPKTNANYVRAVLAF